jgi:excisionase family DNA binding protein
MIRMTIPDDLIELPDAARLIGVSYQTAHRWIKTGQLPGYRIGGRYRVSKRDVMDMVQPFDANAHQADVAASRPLSRRELAARDAETDQVLRAAGVRR